MLNPVMLLALCVIAGIGTAIALPSRMELSMRRIGGVILLASGVMLVAWLASVMKSGMGGYFWVFAIIAVVSAVRVITHERPVYSALYFVLTVLASAGLFILLSAEFMAAALVLIYAGAILITYVFVIMLAAQTTPGDKPLVGVAEYDAVSRERVIASAVGFALAGVMLFVIFDKASAKTGIESRPAAVAGGQMATGDLGAYLFTHQALALELAGLILTLAMVGAIIIARRQVVGGIVNENEPVEQVNSIATPVDDNPHSIPVYGTANPRAKAYPQT